jgi:hypothetical protein
MGLAPPPPRLGESPKTGAQAIPGAVPVLGEGDEDDGTITASAPAALGSSPLPLTTPGSVEIREMPAGDDALDETEVRTVVKQLPPEVEGAADATDAPAGAAVRSQADEPDDSVTRDAPLPIGQLPEQRGGMSSSVSARPAIPKPVPAAGRRPDEIARLYESDERLSDRDLFAKPPPAAGRRSDEIARPYESEDRLPDRRGYPKPLPAAGQGPETIARPYESDERLSDRDTYESDESVTTRGLPVRDDYNDDDSVTALAPPHRAATLGHLPSLDEPADERDNTTTAAAQPPVPPRVSPLYDGHDQNTTEIMTNAPASSGDEPLGSPSVHQTSDSSLRIAPSAVRSGDHVNLGIMMSAGSAVHDVRDPAQNPLGVTGPFQVYADRPLDPSLHDFHFSGPPRKPRYGLLVIAVGFVSFAIPLLLFLWLHQTRLDGPSPRFASQVVPDTVGRRDPTRAKATKPTPSNSASSIQSGGGGRGGPGLRRK